MPVTARHRHDVPPAVHVTGAVGGPPGGWYGAVRTDAEGPAPTRCYGCNFSPIFDVTLMVTVPSGRQNGAVGAKPDGMRFTGVTGGMDISGRYGDDIVPVADSAFAGAAVTDGDHCPVLSHRDRVASGRSQHVSMSPVECLHTARIPASGGPALRPKYVYYTDKPAESVCKR